MQLPGLLAQPVQQQLLGDLRFLGFQGLRFGGMLLVSVDTLCCILFYMPDVHIIYIYIYIYMYIHTCIIIYTCRFGKYRGSELSRYQ